LLDCNGRPAKFAKVKLGQTLETTNEDGVFSGNVMANTAFDFVVSDPAYTTVTIPVSPQTAGTTKDLGDISVSCPGFVKVKVECSNNSAFYGYINAETGGKSKSIPIYAKGEFSIPVAPNGGTATIIVTNAITGQSATRSATLPTQTGQTVDAGTFEVCTQGTASLNNSFTINGDGFTNQNITITSQAITSFAYYNTSDSLMGGISIGTITGVPGFTSGGFTLVFPGKVPATFPKPNADDALLILTLGNRSYLPQEDSVAHLNITEVGPVGGRIKGTFRMAARRVEFDTATGQSREFKVSITNGQIEMVRQADQ